MTRLTRPVLSILTALVMIGTLFFGAPAQVRALPQTVYVGHLVNDYAPGSDCANPHYSTGGNWTGGGAYNSDNDAIQDATDNAASGSVIYICSGTYVFAEEVTVGAGKSLTFRGDRNETLLDGNDLTRIFNSNAAWSSDQGGVLSLRDLLITDAKITSWNGGSIESDGLALDNVTITGSEGACNGGALYAEGSITIVDSTLTGNISYCDGGALYAWGGSPVSISNSEFDGNRSNGDGGAIVAASVTATGSTFARNSANNGGAISAHTVSVTASTFIDNHANVFGGAILALDYNTVVAAVISSTFTGNSALYGGAIESFGTTTISRSGFTGNHAFIGGAISAAAVALTNSTFTNNEATSDGGAIWAYSTATVANSTFTDNSSAYGGAISAVAVALTSSTFTNNEATFVGGAISVYAATVTASTFTNNQAGYYGGAIYASTRVTIVRSRFTKNQVTYYGGAISARTATIARSRFTRNTANGHGGAVIFWHAEKSDLLQLRRNSFIGNRAGAGGAITLASCGRVYSQSQLARIAAANQFSMNRATKQRRTANFETGFCD